MKRDRQETEQRLLIATGQVLARDGFRKVGVNSIAKQAGVDKVLIYRYFDGLDGLVKRYAAQGDFWPGIDELLGEELIGNKAQAFRSYPLPEQVARVFENYIDAIRSRPLTLEILAWEMVERNELTAHLETIRENLGQQLISLIDPGELSDPELFAGVTALMSASIHYLATRARHIRIYNGINLREEAGWDQIKRALRHLALSSI
ncbi:TetR/AcrR family transcriptional regulator [Motiliproteus sp. MSK22-1]|uniref:TetR/AcrR family transcriptional regulator n=1 Tax=Motiliproteus sp. MSK22-1 TaxID=1897630 RepID=UPI000976CA44|nr:TetR/AcrR family transcriptional regulator [Motiliproteus sp. MSK22-1]OMH33660.1 hypothetical protein BGP75_11650 [Motiliproteus sp. MSK22-1]